MIQLLKGARTAAAKFTYSVRFRFSADTEGSGRESMARTLWREALWCWSTSVITRPWPSRRMRAGSKLRCQATAGSGKSDTECTGRIHVLKWGRSERVSLGLQPKCQILATTMSPPVLTKSPISPLAVSLSYSWSEDHTSKREAVFSSTPAQPVLMRAGPNFCWTT